MAKKEFTPEAVKIEYDRELTGEWFYCNAHAYYKGKHIKTAEGFIYPDEKPRLLNMIFKGKQEPVDLIKIIVLIEWSNGKATKDHRKKK